MNIDEIKVDVVTRRFHDRLDDEAHHLAQCLLPLCESPIEVMMGVALLCYDRMCDPWPRSFGNPLAIETFDCASDYPTRQRLLIPQYPHLGYRVDFALRDDPHLVFIECDGHDFHERTKEQAIRDRKKDRTVQTGGNNILRFTGSEIYKDCFDCARQVFAFVLELSVPPELRSAAG